jgi:hypothetical protein
MSSRKTHCQSACTETNMAVFLFFKKENLTKAHFIIKPVVSKVVLLKYWLYGVPSKEKIP